MDKHYAPFDGVGDTSANDQWACPAGPLFSSSKTKPCHFSSV